MMWFKCIILNQNVYIKISIDPNKNLFKSRWSCVVIIISRYTEAVQLNFKLYIIRVAVLYLNFILSARTCLLTTQLVLSATFFQAKHQGWILIYYFTKSFGWVIFVQIMIFFKTDNFVSYGIFFNWTHLQLATPWGNWSSIVSNSCVWRINYVPNNNP